MPGTFGAKTGAIPRIRSVAVHDVAVFAAPAQTDRCCF
jgi:hypothetical protein